MNPTLRRSPQRPRMLSSHPYPRYPLPTLR